MGSIELGRISDIKIRSYRADFDNVVYIYDDIMFLIFFTNESIKQNDILKSKFFIHSKGKNSCLYH